MNIVIVIPTYNEKENIVKLIPVLQDDVFPKIKHHSMKILIADDNSPDGTAEEVKKFMKKWDNIALSTGEKKGLGAAYIRGMSYAIEKLDADVLFEMDADFFHDPYKVPDFVKKIDEGNDFVVGTRYSDGGSIPKTWAVDRRFLSVVGNWIIRAIFMRPAIHDWTGGYRALKKEVFLAEKEKLAPYTGYRFQIAFLHKAIQDGFKVAEVPFHATDRTAGRSKMAKGETIVDTLLYVFSARLEELKKSRFFKFLVVGGTGFLVQIVMQEVTIRTGLTLHLAKGFDAIMGIHHANLNPLSQSIGAGIGAEAAILSNFFLNNYWTFQDTRSMKHKSPGIIRLLKFNMTSFGAILIQSLAVWIGIKTLGDSVRLVALSIPTRILVLFPTIVLIVIPLNYIIYNKVIWKTHKLKQSS